MLFYFNGDSNVAGEELDNPSTESMVFHISNHYGATSVCDALSGASNDRIYDTTIAYLNNNPAPDLVVIGWSEHGREQWWIDSKFHQINSLDIGNRPPENLRRRHQLWKNYIKNDPDWHRVMGIYWHNKIFNLHTMLQERKIPHLFFNAFFCFHIGDYEKLDWSGNFYCPYYQNRTYINWCVEHGFQEITPGWQHYPAEAHKSWAQEMLQTLKQDLSL